MRDVLETKTRDELVEIAKTLNIKPHHKALEKTIIDQIMAQPVAHIEAALTGTRTPTGIDPFKHPTQQAVEPPKMNTQEDVLKAVKHITDAKPDFKVTFLDEGTSWHFAFRGAEEAGHMSTPIRVIAQKAGNVAKGRRALMSLGKDNTYPGKYTDTILTFAG